MKNDMLALLPIPEDYHVVQTDVRKRNKVQVTVDRYQNVDEVTPNNKHLTLVTDRNGNLISFNASTFKNGGKLPSADKALRQAVTLFNQLDPNYADDLSYMRTEHAIMKITGCRLARQFTGSSLPIATVPITGSPSGPTTRLLKLSASRFGITSEIDGQPKCGTMTIGFWRDKARSHN